MISDPRRTTVTVHALVVPPELHSQGHGTRLLQALMCCFVGRKWVVPTIVPLPVEGRGNVFVQAGYVPSPLTGYLLERRL